MSDRTVRLDARPIDVPLKKPFGIAGGAQDVARNVLVRAVLSDGSVGWGEAAPFPAFNGETQQGTLAAIDRVRDAVLASTADGVADAAAEAIAGAGAARCAIETAVLDARCRARGDRLFGARADSLRTDVTIPIGPVDECASDARSWSTLGFARLKIKIGGAGLDDAFARVVAVHEAAPGAELLLDGNAGLSSDHAIALVRALDARGIRPILFEQPCAKDDVGGLLAVASASDVPVALDESVSTVADLARFAHGERLVVNVKPMKAGFAEALRVARAARDLGMRLMIGGMVETKMAMSASACFASGYRALHGLEWDLVDLDTPLFLAEDPFDGGYEQTGDVLDLSPIVAGHGVVPRRAAFDV